MKPAPQEGLQAAGAITHATTKAETRITIRSRKTTSTTIRTTRTTITTNTRRSSLHALPSLGATTTAPQSQKGGAHCAHAPLGRFPRLVLTIKPGCSAQRPTHVEWSGGGGAHVQEGSRQSLISTPTHLAQCPLHSPSCLPASKTARERTCFSRPAHCVRHRPLPQPTRPRHGAEFAPAESAQRTRVPGPNRAADASEFPDAS